MKIYKTRPFARWAEDEDITSALVLKTAKEMEAGLIDANLGAGLYKKRLPNKQQGKRSGRRAIVAMKTETRTVFIHGYSKNRKGNIKRKELDTYREIAKQYLSFSQETIDNLIHANDLMEVTQND
jgi:hypothetical protein